MAFSLPTKATGLREIDQSFLDLRTDSEIIAQFNTFQPNTSEKNVWVMWDNGFERTYPTHQQTVLNWIDEPDLVKRAEAEDFVLEMLEKSHIYKVYHNSMAGLPALGDLIKKKENQDVTFRPGTFGELCRYGTVYWEATRKVERLEPQRNGSGLIHGTPTRTAASFMNYIRIAG